MAQVDESGLPILPSLHNASAHVVTLAFDLVIGGWTREVPGILATQNEEGMKFYNGRKSVSQKEQASEQPASRTKTGDCLVREPDAQRSKCRSGYPTGLSYPANPHKQDAGRE